MKRPLLILVLLAGSLLSRSQHVILSVSAAGGNWYQNNGISTHFTVGEAVINTIGTSDVRFTQGFQQPGLNRSLTGTICYDNTQATPLGNIPVILKQDGIVMYSTLTDATGFFRFTNLPGGTYHLTATCAKPWGGGNGADALLAMKDFVGLSPLPPLRHLAADVDSGSYVNAADALLIMKRFTMLTNHFGRGDWCFEDQVVNFDGQTNQTVNFKGLCVGDVNGSFTLETRTEPGLQLANRSTQLLDQGLDIDIPITIQSDVDISAFSIAVNYPDDIKILDLVDCMQGDRMVYHCINNQVRIAWFALRNVRLKANDALVVLKARVVNPMVSISAPSDFSLDPESDLFDFGGQPLHGETLLVPKLVWKNDGFALNQNIPNPSNEFTRISYDIPQDGLCRIVLLDVTGKEITVLENAQREAGNHVVLVHTTGWAPGVYLYKMQYNIDNQQFSQVKRMIVCR